MTSDYSKKIQIKNDVENAFSALSTINGLKGWWTPLVTGSTKINGKLKFEFEGMDEYIVMQVEQSDAPHLIAWKCLVHTDLPEWSGTKIQFEFIKKDAHSCVLDFVHVGLTPKLECFEDCKLGWNHFLGSIKNFIETGKGDPFGK